MRGLCLAALVSLPVLPLAAAEPPDDPVSGPLAGLKPAAEISIRFTPGVPLLTEDSRARLKPAIAGAKAPPCYWIAEARSAGEADALRAALAEYDIAVETIIAAANPASPAAEARAYCAPPPRVTAYFPPGQAVLNEEARAALALAVAGHWRSKTPLVVRGYAGAQEAADPLKLGLDRAQAARDYLIAAGLAPIQLAIEANTQATGRNALRVEITASTPP